MPVAGKIHPMKISLEKRNHLIVVALFTLAALALIWFVPIKIQRAKRAEIATQIDAAIEQQQRMDVAVKSAKKVEEELKVANQQLRQIEEEMATGDLYSWMYSLIKNFKSSYRVEIPQFSPLEVGNVTLVPKFPFKQVKMIINGTGYFHDVGIFLAGFENTFPHIRVQNLELVPASGADQTDREKLAFRMDVVALINSTTLEKK
jgi:hypothetical protein